MRMSEAHLGSVAKDAPEVFLDGFRVSLPKARRSVASIRAYLERLALEQQRILCSFHVVEDYPTGDQQRRADKPQTRVEALTIDLTQTPLYLILTAREQAAQAKADRLQRRAALAVRHMLRCQAQLLRNASHALA